MVLDKPLILASGSPRRRELLALAGIPFAVQVSHCAEESRQIDPEMLVKELSRQKAEDVAAAGGEPAYILGADTVVAIDGQILGKPHDAADARRMIRLIAGKTHQVYTGVTLLEQTGDGIARRENFAVCTDVVVAPMTEEEVEAYIAPVEEPAVLAEGLEASAKPEWQDKAGAYAIQGTFGARHITALAGDYYNVVGLPVGRVYALLRDWMK